MPTSFCSTRSCECHLQQSTALAAFHTSVTFVCDNLSRQDWVALMEGISNKGIQTALRLMGVASEAVAQVCPQLPTLG